MRHLTKSVLSVLLIMALCVSLLSGLVLSGHAAQVDYVTGNANGFSNVIKNWGERGTNATFLSPNAEAFYQDNNTTYSSLASLSGSALYNRLQKLMKDNHKVITSYADTRDLYRFTDCQNSDSSSISSFYSGKSIGPSWDSGKTWNREHTWPNSKGLEGSDEDDIMMLRPTSVNENGARGNKAYGESSQYYNPNAFTNNQYDIRGDVARIALYVYVRWGNTNLYGTGGVIESEQILLKWMAADPVDTWEMGRNDSVESITGTRNVFVDYPELAYIMFDKVIPSDLVSPSGESYSGYDITATVNNSAFGSVSVNGNTVFASPAAGYQVSGYTLTSGTAKVTREGNVFQVLASSDCSIRINFEVRKAVTVSFLEDGAKVDSQSAYNGDVITLPKHKGAVAKGYSFAGWVTNKLNETTECPASLYPAGSKYNVSGNVTFYALYSRLDKNSTSQSNVFVSYSGVPVAGDYLIVSNGGAMKASLTNGRFNFSDVSINSDIISSPDASVIWHIEPVGDGKFTIYNASTSSYAGGTGVKNKGALLKSVNDFAKWTISGSAVFENVGNKASNVNYTLRRNENYGFACYAPSLGTGMTLYKLNEGALMYSTSTGSGCQHVNTTTVAAQRPTCTKAGFTAGVYCNDCKSYISGHDNLKANGHKYISQVTPPTENKQGYTTYTCSVCSDSYISDYTDVLHKSHVVTFVVPTSVDKIQSVQCGSEGIKLPAAGDFTDTYQYTFVGWSAEKVSNTPTKPKVVLAGSQFTTGTDTVLYALYSFTSEGGTITYTTEFFCDHQGKYVAAVSADCKNEGTIAHYLCDNCGKFFADAHFSEELTSIVDPKQDHIYGDWKVTVKPTSDAAGRKERVCSICGDIQEDTLPAEPTVNVPDEPGIDTPDEPDIDTPEKPEPSTSNAGWVILCVVLIIVAAGAAVVIVLWIKKKKN